MTPEEKLQELGIDLPEAPSAAGSYVPVISTGSLLFISGTLPFVEGKLIRYGRVGEDVTIDEAREDARRTVLNALASLRSYTGSLNTVKRCIKIIGYIASAPDFTEQPKVLNAASDLICDIFGEAGKHARAAVGVTILPLNAPVEIEFIFETE